MNGLRGLPGSALGRAVAAVLAVTLLGTSVFILWPRGANGPSPAPSPTDRIGSATPPRIPIAVTAARRDIGPALVGATMTIAAHALGEAPIATLELWDGPELVATHHASSSRPALSARWTWTPETSGQHLLLARAVDAMGRVRQSNAVWIAVQPSEADGSGLAARLAVASVRPASAISLPAVETTLDGCSLELSLGGGATASGFTFYALPRNGVTFTTLGSLATGAADRGYTIPLSGGTNAIVVGSFDATVEVLGPPVLVDAPDTCGAGDWTGGIAIGPDNRLIGGPRVDRGYLYVQSGTDAAVRIPARSFVEATDGILDFSGHLPPVYDDGPVRIEAWGWVDDSLVAIGNGTWTPPPTGGPSPSSPSGGLPPVAAPFGGPLLAPGIVTTLDVVRTTTVAGPQPCGKEFCAVDLLLEEDEVIWPTSNGQPSAKRTLRWSTLMPLVDSIVWQLLPYAPAGNPDLAPPFVVDQGTISVPPGTTSGEFEIDFAKYLGPQSVTADLIGASLAPAVGTPTFVFPGASTPLPPPNPTPNAGSGGLVQVPIGQLIPSKITNRAYVRIILMQGPSPSAVSNHVRFDVVSPPDPIMLDVPPGYSENKDAFTVAWSFTPPKAADPAYARCAVVTGHTASYKPPPPIWPWTYEIGQVHCYTPPSGDGDLLGLIEDGFEAFVNLVEDVWEGISDGYAWIQDQVVKAILFAVPCKQIASDAACEAIAKTALSVALASLGVPPTLPDFGTVMNGLKGDLRTLVLEAAKTQFPGVAEACGLASAGNVVSSKVATCEALVDDAIDEVIAQIEAEVGAAAGAATGKAWPGVIFAPDPRGVYQVPTVTMTLTRTAALPVPHECTATARMTSTKSNHSWPELSGGYPKTATGTVSGQPFLAESFTIPPMEPGETLTRTAWLADPATWHESQAAWKYWYYYEALAKPNRAWVLLQAGSELTFEISSNCFQTSTQGPHVLTQSATGG